MDHLDHRGIQPYTIAAARSRNTISACRALTDNRRCGYITGLQRMHEGFAFTVYQLGTYGTYLLGYQGTKQLSRVSNTGRVILNGILVQQICSCTVSQNQSICSCAVVIGGRETLVMQASCAAGCNNNNLCSCDQVLIGLHILENRAGNLALVILDQLNG